MAVWMSVRTFNKAGILKILSFLRYIPITLFTMVHPISYLLYYSRIKTGAHVFRFRNGIRIRDTDGAAAGTIAVIFLRKSYGNPINNNLIIDIGANIGIFSLFEAQSSSAPTVLCYEPIPENYELLIENIRANNLESKIRASNLGVASVKGKRRFFLSSSPLHTYVEGDENDKSAMIECTTLDEIMRRHEVKMVDLLKLNCEGAEYEILYSSADCLQQIREIRFEYHNIDDKSQNRDALCSFLETKGFLITKTKKNNAFDGFIWAENRTLGVPAQRSKTVLGQEGLQTKFPDRRRGRASA
jgi:FkbM family methyltransferase